MKNGMTLLMFVLACCLFAPAQSDMSGDSMKKDKAMKDDGGKMTSMTGCVAEKDGKYMMMNKAHPDGVQLMSSEDLKPHVGHKVQVKGMMEKMDGMSGGSMKSGDNMKSDGKMSDDKMSKDDKMKHDNMGMMAMKVSTMKMMSETCDMSKMGK
jgi:hypothetical protein